MSKIWVAIMMMNLKKKKKVTGKLLNILDNNKYTLMILNHLDYQGHL
jgi:hypothetical protein